MQPQHLQRDLQIQEVIDKLALKLLVERKEDLQQPVNRVRSSFLNYCQIPLNALVPDGLVSIWEEASTRVYQSEKAKDGVNERIKSISEGDTTIQFESSTELPSFQTVIESYRYELNQYRRIFPW